MFSSLKHRFPHGFPIVFGRHPYVLLEVFAEEGLRGEIERHRYFLYTQVGSLEELLGFADDHLHDPLQSARARLLFDNGGKVSGREMLASGIKAHLPFPTIETEKREHEVLENHILIALRQGHHGLIGEVDIQHFVAESLSHGLGNLCQQMLPAVADARFFAPSQASYRFRNKEKR